MGPSSCDWHNPCSPYCLFLVHPYNMTDHLILASSTFITILATHALLLTFSFFRCCLKDVPCDHLSILASIVSSSISFFCLSALFSAPYNITGLTTTLYTFALNLMLILRSQITLLIIFHFLRAAATYSLTSASILPASVTIDSKYLNC